MLVSQIAELDTHAVIGGGKAHAFQMSDSAEFFTILSDTLYRDKKRAVVREVTCNAWDAHIMVGKIDLPIEITLTDEELIIKDFGPGIAQDRIVSVYCVYGGSTKAKDETQTGGFGLGCKAPFAYSDHFSVTSCHDGKRTVYAISRGGAETNGKPDIRAMVSVPTTETGITVSIPIKSAADRIELEKIIKSVIYYGGMIANLNGELLPRLNYDLARKQRFCVLPENTAERFDALHESKVYVLYGTVIYPIQTTDREIMDLVEHLSRYVERSYRAILIAPPNSIGVTPSREGLSYSELTINTVKDLMNRTIKLLKQHVPAARKQYYRDAVAKMERYKITTYLGGVSNVYAEFLTDPFEITRRSVSAGGYSGSGDVGRDEIRKALQHRFKDDRRIFRRMQAPFDFTMEAVIHSRRLILRLASKLNLLSSLYYHNSGDYSSRKFYPIDTVSLRYSNVFDGDILVTPTHRDASKWIKNKRDEAERRYWSGDSGRERAKSYMIFVVPRSTPEQRDEIVALAAKYKIGVNVLPFTPRKARGKSGSTKSFYDFSKIKWDGGAVSIAQIPTLEKASIYVRCTGHPADMKFERYYRNNREELLRVFPEIAVAMNAKQEAKLKAAGARNVNDLILEEVRKVFNRRDVQYAHCAKNGLFIHGESSDWRSVSEMIRRAVEKDIRYAKLFFPDRVKFGEGFERSKDLIHLLDEVIGHSKDRAKLIDEIDEKCRKVFAKLILPFKEVDKKFASLKILTSMGLNSDDKDVEEVCDIIRFLMRRNRQSTLNDEPDELESLKEAA